MTTTSITKTPPVTRQMVLAHVAISVTDLARARNFYVDVLGLEEVRRPEFSVPGSWLTTGAGMIHLALVASIPEPRDKVAHFALQVPTDQIGVLAQAVVHGGGSVVMAPREREDLGLLVTSAILRDTEGNKFELTDLGESTP